LVKLIKMLLRVIAILLAILILAIAALSIYAAIDKEDSFFVSGAALENPGWLGEVDAHRNDGFQARREYLSVYAHRIKQGIGTVLGYRLYSNGSLLAIDDESYIKLTIWVSERTPAQHAEYDLSDRDRIVAIYSRGGSAWPAFGCAGFIARGKVTIEGGDGAKRVDVAGVFEPMESASDEHCRQAEFVQTFTATKMDLSKITPWLGKAGNHPYRETYR